MSESQVAPPTIPAPVPPAPRATVPGAAVSTWQIFAEFLMIGATSFGGVVPYLRGRLVDHRGWLDDRDFVEMLSMSQSLPGLNATNMAVLLGDRLPRRHRRHLPARCRADVRRRRGVPRAS